MAGPEFPEYATKYSKAARTLRDGLSPEMRAVLMEIENDLADNPEKYPSRLIPLDATMIVYRHPKPQIEVTYRLDRENKIIYFLHLVAPSLDVRKTLFISYSHKDEQWLLELKRFLKPLEQRDIVNIWDDQKIKAGADWRQEIEKALASAKAAVLLISMDFLNSDFIASNELPALLNAAQDKGLNIFWVAVGPSTVLDTAIAKYQAAHDKPPLAGIKDAADRDEHYLRIYNRIKEAVGG